MSPTLRLYIQEMGKHGLPGMQQEVVETVVDMAFPPAKQSEIDAKP